MPPGYVTHRLHTLKLLSLLYLLQFAHIGQRLLLKVQLHGFHLAVSLGGGGWSGRGDTHRDLKKKNGTFLGKGGYWWW